MGNQHAKLIYQQQSYIFINISFIIIINMRIILGINLKKAKQYLYRINYNMIEAHRRTR